MAFILLNLDSLSSQVLNEDDKVLNLTENSEFKKMKKTDSEWRRILSSAEYYILREKGTERAFTGEYDGHFEDGIYVCAGCGHKLFDCFFFCIIFIFRIDCFRI